MYLMLGSRQELLTVADNIWLCRAVLNCSLKCASPPAQPPELLALFFFFFFCLYCMYVHACTGFQ